jgi:hypothetical protein
MPLICPRNSAKRITSKSIRLAVDALILHGQPSTPKEAKLLVDFSEHFHTNQELMPYLIRQSRQQVHSEGWASFDLAFANAMVHLQTPGGRMYKLPAQFKSLYVRSLIRCCPELNSFFELRLSIADRIFKTTIYKGWLVWPDDTVCFSSHDTQAQRELFTVSE